MSLRLETALQISNDESLQQKPSDKLNTYRVNAYMHARKTIEFIIKPTIILFCMSNEIYFLTV